MMGKGRLCVMGLCGVGESHAPDAFAAVLNQTTDTHLSATRINNDGIMQGTALPSTPPVWVATTGVPATDDVLDVSIHATRVGGDLMPSTTFWPTVEFLSTPPVWVATDYVTRMVPAMFVSIHATRVGGDASWHVLGQGKVVSIHATRVGGDAASLADSAALWEVSIHATRVGGDGSRK